MIIDHSHARNQFVNWGGETRGLIVVAIVCIWGNGFPRTILTASELPADRKSVDDGDNANDTSIETNPDVDQTRNYFDSWIENTIYGREGQEKGIRRFHDLLRYELSNAKKTHDLNAEHCKKLELAGHGDIKRFTEKITAFRDRQIRNGLAAAIWNPILRVKRDAAGLLQMKRNAADLRRLKEELAELQEQGELDVLFGPESLYGKTLKKIVEHSKRKPDANRDDYYLKLMLLMVSNSLDATGPLRADQREPLIALLQERIQNSPAVLFHDQDELLVRLMEIPIEKFEGILDQKQNQILHVNLEALQKQRVKDQRK